MTFYINQPVECIDDTNMDVAAQWKCGLPVQGQRYHVRSIIVHGGKTYLRLCEILMPSNSKRGFGEGAFSAMRFRPLVERKTDISIFTHMLTDQKVNA